MKLKLFDFWRSFLDLLMGKRDFIYELSFITCSFIIIAGLVVLCMSSSLMTFILAVLAIVVSLVGVIASIVPHRRIMMFVDCVNIFVLFYTLFKLKQGYGQAQLAYAFYISITLLYLWRFVVEGLKDGSNSSRVSKMVK